MDFEEIKQRLVFDEPTASEPVPKLKEILYEPYPCEDCGKILEQRRVVEQRISQNKVSTKCMVCKQFKNPITGEFDCDIYQKNAILQRLKSKKNK